MSRGERLVSDLVNGLRNNKLRRQDTVSYKKQEGFPQIKNSVVGIPAI